MTDRIKFDVALMRGHEPQNLIDYCGFFALSEVLKPSKNPLASLTIALPQEFGEGHILMAATLAVVTGRRVDFVFTQSPEDSAYCKADFVFAPVSPLWGGEEDALERFLGVLGHTAWFVNQFEEDSMRNAFFRGIWNRTCEFITDSMELDRLNRVAPDKMASHAMGEAKRMVERILRSCLIRDDMMATVREIMGHSYDNYAIIVPERASSMHHGLMLQWIADVQETSQLPDKDLHMEVIIIHDWQRKTWNVYPALEHVNGRYQEVQGIGWSLKHRKILKAVGCDSIQDGNSYYAVCPDKKKAIAVAQWLWERSQGKNTLLETLV